MEHKIQTETLLEQFLNIMISSLFCGLYALALSLFSRSTELEFMGNTFYFCIFIFFVSAVIFQTLLDMFRQPHNKIAFNLRILFFYIILILIICFMFNQIYAPYYLIPGIIIEYIIIDFLDKPLLYQDKFTFQIENWEGTELGRNLRSDSLTVETLNKSIDTNRIMLTILCGIVLLGLITGSQFVKFSDYPVVILLVIIFSILFFLSVAFISVIYNVFQKNTYFSFLGFKNSIDSKGLIIRTALTIVILSGLFGTAFSSNKSIFNLNGLIKEKNRYFQPAPIEPKSYDIHSFEINQSELEFFDITTRETPILDTIFKILQIAIVVAAIIYLIYLIVHFIFTTHFVSFFKENMIAKILNEIYAKISEFFSTLFSRKKKTKELYATVNSKNFKKRIGEYLKKSNKSDEKKQELDRLTKQFMHIIEWGDNKKISFKNTLAPAEYTKLLYEYLLTQDEEISKKADITLKIGFLYEKALYAEQLLTVAEEKEFFEKTAEILGIV